jgi:hypothetical protein
VNAKDHSDAHPQADSTWVNRWNDWVAAEPDAPGVWKRRDGGYRVRGRVTDPRTGKLREVNRALPDCATAREAAALLDGELAEIAAGSNRMRGKIVRKERESKVVFQVYGRANGKHVYVGTYDTEAEAIEARDTHAARNRKSGEKIVAFKLYAIHADGAESLLIHDTFGADHRTYEISVNSESIGVWLQQLRDATSTGEPMSDDEFRRWYYDDEPLASNASSVHEAPF